MHPDFWRSAWREGRTAFHRDEVNSTLRTHGERVFGAAPGRLLVPLCGKTLDLAWLAARGHEAVGVELARQAIEELFAREGVAPVIVEHGAYREWDSTRGWRVLEADILTLGPESAGLGGLFDGVWDRAALVALDPERRVAYARVVTSLLRPGGTVLLETFDFDGARKPGPPHAVPADEVARLWPWRAERLEQRDLTAESVARGWDVDRVMNEVWSLRAP